jgi:hypothetical protein
MKDITAWNEYCKSLSALLIEACTSTPVSGGPGALSKELGKVAPDWHFRHILCRGGWYRLGGVVDAQGKRLSDSLESWAGALLDEHDGDFSALAETLADKEYYATRLIGRTHYLVAPAGEGVGDFLQLEIEDLLEVRAHRLFGGSTLPTTLDELIDPPQDSQLQVPLAPPAYQFRRLTHVGAYLDRMLAQRPEAAPIHRMLDDWKNSSAGSTSAFCNHWVIAMREHLDRYQQPIFRAQPIATLAGDPPTFNAEAGTSGKALQEALQAFDRGVGYPFAWYFHMLTTKAVPYWVAQAVVEDTLGGFAYLPQRDIDVVRNWLHRSYAP